MGDGGDVLHAEYDALGLARGRFAGAEGDLRAVDGPLRAALERLREAAGEFTSRVGPGADRFLLDGGQAAGLLAEAAALIAGNIGRAGVDLAAVDAGAVPRL